MRSVTDPGPGSKPSPPTLSIIVPTYNERETITRTITALMDHIPPDTEIIIVDDDSPDRTWEVVEQVYATTPRVHVERRTEDRGLGTAIIHGFERSSGSYCLVMDADLQHPPTAIPRMVAEAEDGAAIVVGTRYGDDGRIDGWPLFRRFISRGAVAIAHLLLPQTRSITDPISGFFLVEADVIQNLDLQPRGWKILLDMLAHTDRPTREVGYRFRNRDLGLSKLTLGDCLTYLIHVLDLSIASVRYDDQEAVPIPASDHAD